MPVRVGLPGFRVSLSQPPNARCVWHEIASCPDLFNLKIDGSLEHFSTGRSNAKPRPFRSCRPPGSLGSQTLGSGGVPPPGEGASGEDDAVATLAHVTGRV